MSSLLIIKELNFKLEQERGSNGSTTISIQLTSSIIPRTTTPIDDELSTVSSTISTRNTSRTTIQIEDKSVATLKPDKSNF